jgi:hypothetical protein
MLFKRSTALSDLPAAKQIQNFGIIIYRMGNENEHCLVSLLEAYNIFAVPGQTKTKTISFQQLTSFGLKKYLLFYLKRLNCALI